MHTIKIKIHDKVYKQFIWLLSKFSKDEIEIIHNDDSYYATQVELQKELDEINEGKAKFQTLDQLEERLENQIKKHEDNL